MSKEITQICKSCGAIGSANYCNICGQAFNSSRLTTKSILHEVFHFLTHLDKGFPFTLKKLLIEPGQMQRKYVEGTRNRHQKPFSMFFIFASFAALALYWINQTLIKYFNAGDVEEGAFFHKYWVVLQICLLPLYTLITYLFFRKAKYNYAEICVLLLYQFSFLFILLTAIHLMRFIWPHLQTRYIEFPLIIIYSTITNMNFFNKISRWAAILNSMLSIALCFLLASYVQDILIKVFY